MVLNGNLALSISKLFENEKDRLQLHMNIKKNDWHGKFISP
jgi:hypothetical protein